MIAPNPNTGCFGARLYYFDFLEEETRANVPEAVSEHIAECEYCQEEISRLGDVLTSASATVESEQDRCTATLVTILKLHFAYVGKSVTCSTVRPFLSSMAVSDFQINIPTPVTVHLDNCRACSDDLLTIRGLELTDKQLYRLGQLFAEKPTEDIVGCTYAQAVAREVGMVVFDRADSEALKHLCLCPDCRKTVYRSREALRIRLLNEASWQSEFPCEQVSAADVFDYCFPYGIDPANDQYAKFRESLASHLRTCPRCLAKMQQLHKSLYGIARRRESGVVTHYEIHSSTKRPEHCETDGLYAEWPISVHVSGKARFSDAVSGKSRRLVLPLRPGKVFSALGIRQVVKPIAAAALILLSVIFLLNGPAASAVDLSRIYEALHNVRNVYIESFQAGEKTPWCKMWISRPKEALLLEREGQTILYDLKRGNQREIDTRDNSSGDELQISAEVKARMQDSLETLFALVPFSDLSKLPGNARWRRVHDKDAALKIPGTEAYDLSWQESENGIVRYRRWRAFVDPRTNLVRRTEWYLKLDPKDEYKFSQCKLPEYLGEEEMPASMQGESSQLGLSAR
jgi:hypothetical protein